MTAIIPRILASKMAFAVVLASLACIMCLLYYITSIVDFIVWTAVAQCCSICAFHYAAYRRSKKLRLEAEK